MPRIALGNRKQSFSNCIGYLRTIVFVLCTGLVLAVATESHGQYVEPASYLNPNTTITLGDSGYSTSGIDDTQAFQDAINDVASSGGGHVIVPRGTYEIGAIDLRSEVHIIFDGHSIIRPYTQGLSANTNLNLFRIGQSFGVENVSVRGLKSGSQFQFDSSAHDRTRAFRIADANNFLVSNLNVADSRTTFSGISLGWGGDAPDGTANIARNGIVEHFRSANAHYGYGAIQAQGSRQVEFRDIESAGGVALRLETGFTLLNLALAVATRMESSVEDVHAENIKSFHGQAALFLAPHAMHQGSVTAENITSTGSEFAVLIQEGSLHKFTDQEISDLGLTIGGWESIDIDGVSATFTNGPIETRFVHMDHYPEELHAQVFRLPDNPPVYDHPYRGPSIAAIVNNVPLDPAVTIANVTSEGFDFHPDEINPDDHFWPTRNGVATDGTPLAGRLLGDINDDQNWTAADLDLLMGQIGVITPGGSESGSAPAGGAFDLVNSDGVADLADVEYWLRGIMGSEFGDANLDGRVSFVDIETIATNYNQPGDWADGDFNNDGVVDRADLDIVESFYAPHPADSQLTFQQAVSLAGLALPGDVDRNGVVNFLDIAPFIGILTASGFQEEADLDGNGVVNFLDIAPFIAILSGVGT